MASDAQLNILIRLQDEASQKLAQLGGSLKNVHDTFASAAAGMGIAGVALTTTVTAPLVALGKSAVEAATTFQQKMELVRTQAGATQQEVVNMSQAVLDLAKHSSQGPEQLADALYHIESLGYRGAQALDILKASSQLAAVGNANLESTTNAVGAAMVTGIKGTEDLHKTMGLLNATIGAGNMRMDDLVAAMSTGILPAAKNFGLSLTDVGAALATLTDNGMRADEGATRLRMTFALMAAPSKNATDSFKSIGLSQLQLANDMRTGGLIKAVEDLKTHLEESGKTASEQAELLSHAFGGGRSSAAILTLIEQVDRLKGKYQAVSDGASQFGNDVTATQQTAAYKLNAAYASIQANLIQIGGILMPLVARASSDLAKAISTVTDWWTHLSAGTQKTILLFIGLAALLGPVLGFLAAVAAAITFLATPIGGVVVAISLLIANIGVWGAIFVTHWNQIKQLFSDGLAWIRSHSQQIGDALQIGILGPFGLVAVGIERNWGQIKQVIANGLNSAIDIINGASKLMSKIPGVNIPQVSHVSFLMGGTMKDDGFAYLHKGEKVTTANNNRYDQGVTVNIYGSISTQHGQSDIEALAKSISQQVQRAGVGI